MAQPPSAVSFRCGTFVDGVCRTSKSNSASGESMKEFLQWIAVMLAHDLAHDGGLLQSNFQASYTVIGNRDVLRGR